jgi:hypothetical protein
MLATRASCNRKNASPFVSCARHGSGIDLTGGSKAVWLKLARNYSSFIIKYNALHHSQPSIGFARFPLKWYH